MTPPLPKPIADYVDANARLDLEAMLKVFATDAVVQDDGGRHQGHDALRAWLQTATIDNRAVFTPDTVCHENGRVVVEGLTAGDFKGSPIRFTLGFTLKDDAVQALEIS
jgi:ketosteroid isomerase-like protein